MPSTSRVGGMVVAARGRPRSQEIDDAVRAALFELLPQVGYANLAIERVARHARVGKPAIYRRWRSKAEMVFALVFHSDDVPSHPDAGSLPADLTLIVRDTMLGFATPIGRMVLPGLMGDLSTDPALVDRFNEIFMAGILAKLEEILRRAVVRGELPSAPDPAEVHMLVTGPVFMWIFGYNRPPSMAAADRFAAAAAAGTVALAAE